MEHPSRTDRAHDVRTSLQRAAQAVGIAFLLVGIAGFIPGVTSNFGDLTFAGHDSDARVLGIFQVSVLHNIVHLLFGVAGLAAARRWSSSRAYLIGGGIIYLALWLYGMFIDMDSSANVVPVNDADNWLHFVLGAGMVALGLLLGRRRDHGPVGHDARFGDAGGRRGADDRRR